MIAQEAGAVVTGSAPAFAKVSQDTSFDVTPDILRGRKYLVVRAIQEEEGETKLDAQRRIVREFYECVEDVEIE